MRHHWRTSAPVIRSRYFEYTALGQPLETVIAARLLPLHPPDRSDPISCLWRGLAANRKNRPKLLSDLEYRELKAAVTKVQNSIADEEAETRWNNLDSRAFLCAEQTLNRYELRLQIANYANEKLVSDREARTKIIIDVRGLQDYNLVPKCGSRTHAETIVRAISENTKSRKQRVFLTDSKLPELNNWLKKYADQFCTLANMPTASEVCLLVDPLGIGNPINEILPTEYCFDKGVNKATVWLDAIAATYSNWFMGNPDVFFEWQSRYEMVATNQWVLNLSPSSKIELEPLVDPSVRVITTGSENSTTEEAINTTDRLPQIPFPRYAVAVGNALFHKNLAAAAAAFSRNTNSAIGLIVWGRITRQQELGIEAICAHLRVPASRICYLSNLSENEVSSMLTNAELVIIPSFHEGFSLPVIEAITHGTPVVASNISAHQELIGPGWWLQPPDDPAKLGRAVNRALKDPQSLLRKQKKRLSQSWHSGQVDEKIAEFLDEILN